jgi:hypothetical protein
MESAFARGKLRVKAPLKIGGGNEFKTYLYEGFNPFSWQQLPVFRAGRV